VRTHRKIPDILISTPFSGHPISVERIRVNPPFPQNFSPSANRHPRPISNNSGQIIHVNRDWFRTGRAYNPD
jgi:hypothetical protein